MTNEQASETPTPREFVMLEVQRLRQQNAELLGALEVAFQTLDVLREHFQHGSLRDISGLGGTLSNMTVDAHVKANDAIGKARGEGA